MARKITAPFSLGTFDEVDARAIAAAISRSPMGIQASVTRLFGERDDQPTEWWHVYVPVKHRVACETWLKGWRAGYEHHVILRYKLGKGIEYDDAAKQLGYGPPSLPSLPVAAGRKIPVRPVHMHDRDDACADADCGWAGTPSERK